MSNKQERANDVTIEEYNQAKVWRAETWQIVDSVKALKQQKKQEALGEELDHSIGVFVMRILSDNRTGAHDQLVRLAANDPIDPKDPSGGPQILTLRPIDREGTGRIRTHYISADGVLVKNNLDSTKFEEGYFVGGAGIGEDELLNTAAVLRNPIEATEQQAQSAPLEYPTDY